MTREASKSKTSGGRGSKQAVEKRRVARQLNTILSGGGSRGAAADGRTEKRRKRLLQELKDGRGGKPLKPIDFVTRVHDLLELGESVSSLKKAGVKSRRIEVTPEVQEVADRAQEAYGFRPEAWRMLGLRVGVAASRKGSSASPNRRAGAKRAKKKSGGSRSPRRA